MSAHPKIDALRESIAGALERGDHAAVAETIQPVALELAFEEGTAFRDLITGLPTEIWHRDPAIAAALGSSYRSAHAPRGAAALAYFRAAESAIADSVIPVPAVCRSSVLIGHASALRAQGLLTEAQAKADAAFEILDEELGGPEHVALRARISLERGSIDLDLGLLDSSRKRLEYAHGLATHLTLPEHVESLGALALISYTQGDLEAAARYVGFAHKLDAPQAILESSFAAPVYASEFMVALERYLLDDAAAIEPAFLQAASRNEWEPFALVVTAHLRALRRDPIAALDLLGRAEQLYNDWRPAALARDTGELLRAGILMALDQGDEAFRILSGLPTYERHALCPARFIAKLRLDHGDLHGAKEALRECDELGEAHSPRTLIDVKLLHGAIDFERGNLAASDVSVDRAFFWMARTGTRMPLRHIPGALLGRIVRRAMLRPQSDEVLRILEATLPHTVGSDESAEPLSSRERMVLTYVERGLTVSAMAAELFISPNTVKTHLRRLYKKLGVNTRDEAIRKARSLGLNSEATE